VHEDLVNTYNSIVSKNARVQSVQSRSTVIAPLFYAFMGLLCVGFSVFIDKKLFGFLSLMGLGFLVYAVVIYRVNKRAYSEPKHGA
jgi:cation transporter-like permease